MTPTNTTPDSKMKGSLFDLSLGSDAIVRESACGAVRRVRHADVALAFESSDEVVIIVNLSSRHRVRGRFGARWHMETPAVGTVTVLPPNLPCNFHIDGGCSVLMLRIPFAAVATAAEEEELNHQALEVRLSLNSRDDGLRRQALQAASAQGTEKVHLSAISHSLARELGATVPMRRGGLSSAALRRALECIRENLAGELPLTLLAAEARTSVFHFVRAFQESMGCSPHRFVIARRVERAVELLGEKEIDVGQVAHKSGFSHTSHLARAMRKELGLTPSQVRRCVLP